MDETQQKETESEEQEEEHRDNDDGNKQKQTSILERANEMSKKLEQQITEIKSSLDRLEELQARDMLAGKSKAGEKVQEEKRSSKDYANSIMQGKVNGN